MIVNRFTSEAESAATRYSLLIEGWRALYRQSLNRRNFGTPSQIQAMIEEAYALARTYLDTERLKIEDATNQIALEAHRQTMIELGVTDETDLSEAASEHASALAEYLLSEITIQVERDIAYLKQASIRTRLQIVMSARAQQIGVRAATLQHQIGSGAQLDFFFHDRRNQKWPSKKFIRAVWRQNLVSAYNETVLIDLSEHGIDIAQVQHSSPGSDFNGMRISMNSNLALPTYEEVRNEIFHPNSEAILHKPGD